MNDETWTLPELVTEAQKRVEALPPPKNGQVRAVPDERTIRYYVTLGLLDRPVAMRGRTALYGTRHLAQVVAIKRLQGAGRSLSEIQTMWPSLDATTLARMSGVAIAGAKTGRKDFWKGEAMMMTQPPPATPMPAPTAQPQVGHVYSRGFYSQEQASPVEVRIELAPGATVLIALPDDASLSPADIRALRAAAAPLVSELAKRGLAVTLEEKQP